jgi:hypothetical protein
MGIVLAPRLAEIIWERAPRFTARDVAPGTVVELHRAAAGSELVVWSGASEATIHGAPATNHAFRAWHDAIHLATGIGFTPAEEIHLARLQCAEVARASGDRLADVVWLEIAGQAAEFARTGRFIGDQVAWTLAQLKRMGVYP